MNGKRVHDSDGVLNLGKVNLTDEERYDDGGSEAIHDISLVAPQDHEDTCN